MFKNQCSGGGPGTRPLSLKRMISADRFSTFTGTSVKGFDTQGLQGYLPIRNGGKDIGALFYTVELRDESALLLQRGLAG